jgi:uncharacterized glyoxalase superfamily protein PhnB
VHATEVSPVLGTTDVRRSARWWCEVLGGDLGPDDVFAPAGEAVYAIVSLGAARVHLQIRRGATALEERDAIECDAYLYVDDADALHRRCIDAGATVLRPIGDSGYGLRDFVVETPDRHRVVIGAPIARA